MFRRFLDEGLAQSSYLLACDRIRPAVVIDPRRDIDEPAQRTRQVSAAELRDRHGPSHAVTMVDVRSERGCHAGRIDGALHTPVGKFARRAAGIPRHGAIATVCEGGYRSILAAVLARHGVTNVVNVTGGVSARRALVPATP
jgi:rhodanese-related sulfurtransferase